MLSKKNCFIYSLLFIQVLVVFSQTSITISEYGVYFIDDEIINKIQIPGDITMSEAVSWKNYIILFNSGDTILFYNIINEAVSDYLPSSSEPQFYRPWTRRGTFPLRNQNNNNLLFFNYGMEYELDPVSLKTIRVREWSRSESLHDLHSYLFDNNGHPIRWRTDEERFVFQFTDFGYRLNFDDSGTNYTDIILSHNIDRQKDIYIIRLSNSKRQFVFILNNTNYGDR